jgi:hypothetical protein
MAKLISPMHAAATIQRNPRPCSVEPDDEDRLGEGDEDLLREED